MSVRPEETVGRISFSPGANMLAGNQLMRLRMRVNRAARQPPPISATQGSGFMYLQILSLEMSDNSCEVIVAQQLFGKRKAAVAEGKEYD